jgi:NAD(P)-dependent dehydrogenase (short-subunit alcohol dehydrogenase family)
MSGILLITGGASGIGAETARRAARRGYKVAINYRSRDAQAMGVAADIAAQDGEAVAIPGDMASEADIVRLFNETERVFGRIRPCGSRASTPPRCTSFLPSTSSA